MSYAAARAARVTSFCRCFRLVRLDGATFGFTDHDRPLTFDGLTYEPGAALAASDAASRLGLAPGDLDATGALSSDAITEADISAGLWDGAAVDVFEVDWSDTSARARLGRYTLGQISRGPLAFTAELRSLAARLDRPEGRVHTVTCDVRRLGDARCGLSLAAWTTTGIVVSAAEAGARLVLSGASGFDPVFLARGIATLPGGVEIDIRAGWSRGAEWEVALWSAPATPPTPGQSVTLVAGCDRTAQTCRARFGNLDNFRGFPHMPGAGALTDYAVPGDPGLTGGSRF